MFSFPDISAIDAVINREKFLLQGAKFIACSSTLSVEAQAEIQEEISIITKRLETLERLKVLVQEINILNFPKNIKNFTSPEIIKEFEQLLNSARSTVDDFVISETVTIISKLK